ncbi:unnamed protein product [Medioppia subpectinata]|uniref:K Homology domain-containing protein n=1 Tax=Medioppia subpectinata TaxID=1979941 RepID=A0A7R9KL34_9ACAR|nr:unnamed protein product [Medioppia subpectinata]CAG2105597.1 unnamed protein product [Medioppia subpectinata]
MIKKSVESTFKTKSISLLVYLSRPGLQFFVHYPQTETTIMPYNSWPMTGFSDVIPSPIKNDSINTLNIEEKLKVDRKKFEALLDGNDPSVGTADKFFGDIMAEFKPVVITWPPRLKAGTKSKKDPHVKISGIPLVVKAARIRILHTLDPTRDRVTLKMDVDWTAHSHVIGKAGASIQKVMDLTGCHVHFPDANRTNSNEKSNQVSIAGTALGVSRARIAIRDLLPVIISFNLILGIGSRAALMDKLNRVIQFVERVTETQISLRFNDSTNSALDSTFVTIIIRGLYGRCNYLIEGINLFLEYMNDYMIKEDIIYQMNTDISVQHHNFVMGFEKTNIKDIMKQTGAVITFPEPTHECDSTEELSSNPTIGRRTRKTTINIKASSVESLLMAFELIQLHLPLSLTFDLKEGQEIRLSSIETLAKKWEVNVSVKPKPKQNTKTIWIKAAEKDEWKLFDVRRHIVEDQEINTNALNTAMSSIWLPNESDVSNLSLNTTNESDISFGSSTGKCSPFNRAPGAERFRNL